MTGPSIKSTRYAAEKLQQQEVEITRLKSEMAEAKVKAKKVCAELYRRVTVVVDGLCDEGDRVYLGSTNDADLLRDIKQEWDAARICPALAKGDDHDH